MPGISFTLPHWLYWVGLIVFPLIAMALARRPGAARNRYSVPLGYLILVTGGMLGLHRFYLKSLLGLVYIPIFVFILYANAEEQQARQVFSNVANQLRVAERTLERERPRLEDAEAEIEALRDEVAAAEEGSFARRSAERRLARTERGIETGRTRIAESEALLTELGPERETAAANRARWSSLAGYAFYLILALLAVDAVLLPGMVRRANATIPPHEETEAERALKAAEREETVHDSDYAENWIDRLSLFAGEFTAYWAVIAVFVYYFEVIARYVFGSPTNWAHEAMYLMFGMQYLIAGAYAMLTESHVRVDIFYAPLPKRRKAIVDLLTSIFFFIFAGTLLVTCAIFAWDATVVDEVSFTEWAIAYWPMKWAMVVGGLLLLLQGISKLAQDLRALRGA